SCACLFFFSSRRRHTRLVSDWSSDVCSSDLSPTLRRLQRCAPARLRTIRLCTRIGCLLLVIRSMDQLAQRRTNRHGWAKRRLDRSEERRVGKGGRCEGVGDDEREKGDRQGQI